MMLLLVMYRCAMLLPVLSKWMVYEHVVSGRSTEMRMERCRQPEA